MDPEPLHDNGFFARFRQYEGASLDDASEVAEIEEVVTLSGRRQQRIHRSLEHVQRRFRDGARHVREGRREILRGKMGKGQKQ